MILDLFSAAQSVQAPSLDFNYVSAALVILVGMISALVFCNRKLANFNSENGKKKRETHEQLVQDIYKKGTVPLVVSVSDYIAEQVVEEFNDGEREVIERYEERKFARINPDSADFIDISNFADFAQYDKRVINLIEAHEIVNTHEEDYRLMKQNLKRCYQYCFIPIIFAVLSLAIHIINASFLQNSELLKILVLIALVLSGLSIIPVATFYLKYMKYVRLLDAFEEKLV